jgi:hypothetical protein
MANHIPPPRPTEGTLSDEMAQYESSGFKNAADKAAYEADYGKRAKDHQDEEWRYINSDRDANLFRNVRHNVLIAGFKHSYQDPDTGLSMGRNITIAALAGYCGHQYTTELMDWINDKRVIMVVKAFQAIEVLLHPIYNANHERPSLMRFTESTVPCDCN